ncbi:MAG: hypothetical protein F6J93_35710 [Oscillatoria sp. SIO1A7]|nr:hypothetical protein [Oscillatoria sp. SIO1A7]
MDTSKKKPRRRLTISLGEQEYEFLKNEAEKRGGSVAAEIRYLVRLRIEDQERKSLPGQDPVEQ